LYKTAALIARAVIIWDNGLIRKELIMQKPAETHFPINHLLQKRWSPRAFASYPVDRADLLSLFEAARWTASSSNQQPWSFVVTTNSDPEAHQNFVNILTGRNPLWAQHAPVLVLGVIQKESASGRLNRYAMYDLGQAVANLTVQATELGLSVRQMGGFDPDKARQWFDIPETHDPIVAIAIGYAGNADDLPEPLVEQERAPRFRKPLEAFVYEGAWQKQFEADQPAFSFQLSDVKTYSKS
jgi:nitroreductase